MKRIGLIINPIAGMGGRVGLKGTDGQDILEESRRRGAIPMAMNRAQEAITRLKSFRDCFEIVTCPGKMGEETARTAGFSPHILPMKIRETTSAKETRLAAQTLQNMGVDLLLFAGGDGTARDIYNAVGVSQVALGIPAGVKIHSAVFANRPHTAGDLAAAYITEKTRETREAEVMDIDEKKYRQGTLSAKLFGYLRIPYQKRYVQRQKAASPAHEGYYQEAIACRMVETMTEDILYIVGPGTTTKAIMEKLGLKSSLLGIDLVCQNQLIGLDLNEAQLLEQLTGSSKLIITPIGGQGYILGRGNQQISPEVIRRVGINNIIIVATKDKINGLRGAPLLVDSGDQELDIQLSGYHSIITGYNENIIYKVRP